MCVCTYMCICMFAHTLLGDAVDFLVTVSGGLPHWGHEETLCICLHGCLKEDQGKEGRKGKCQWKPCERVHQETGQKVYIENDSLFHSKPGSTGG